MTTYDTSPERQAFEAWMQERFPSAPLYSRDAKGSLRFGQYCSYAVEDQWETWKARGAIAPSANIADTAVAKPVARVVYGVDVDDDAYARAEWLTNALENGILLYLAATPASSVADAAGAKCCEYCDGTGDVHRADGESLGTCDCGASGVKE
ncbi:hypothetical protein [Caballeronia sp. INML1]|uniref:hypothetical protein n=1 Tax=Caballeronia sp. INML1 TaxID=2921760 RepID=UPI0020277A6A|nr:hypothetical protein [Caballeronia sp. INML1]